MEDNKEQYQEKYEAYKQEMESLLDLMEDLTDDLPYQGDTCEFSQKICLLNAISEVRQNINGLQVEDFFEDENSLAYRKLTGK